MRAAHSCLWSTGECMTYFNLTFTLRFELNYDNSCIILLTHWVTRVLLRLKCMLKWSHTKVVFRSVKIIVKVLCSLINSALRHFCSEACTPRVLSTALKVLPTLCSIMNSDAWNFCSGLSLEWSQTRVSINSEISHDTM